MSLELYKALRADMRNHAVTTAFAALFLWADHTPLLSIDASAIRFVDRFFDLKPNCHT